MKTFEEGEWLAYNADMWLVKEIREGIRSGTSVTYDISNGSVCTMVSPEDRDLFKLTLSVKNAVDSFRKVRSELHEITPPGFNWPDVSQAFEDIFNRICYLYEEYEDDWDNEEFRTACEKLWAEFKKLAEDVRQSTKNINNLNIQGIPMFRSR